MPNHSRTDVFADILGKNSVMRTWYIRLTQSLLLKNQIIKREIKSCSRRKHHKVQHVLYPGFGLGQLLNIFARQDKWFNVLAIDKNPKMVSQSAAYFQSRNQHNIYCKTQNILDFSEDNIFDMCVCINLLNHIEDDRKALQNMFDALKHPGMLLIFNSSHYASEQDTALTQVYHDHKYRNGYSVDQIKSLLKSIGFSKVKARYVYGRPGVLSWKLTTYWPTKMIEYSPLAYAFLPFYTLFCLPLVLVLNLLDIAVLHQTGKCVLVRAFKS
jgi:SAM-dependent methyltransferase